LPADAQIYQWKDQDGKTVISDKPPIGQVQQQRQIDSGASSADAPSPLPSLTDRELEFRKRQQEARENAEKAQEEAQAAARKDEACQNARRQLRALESGERIALRDDKGERYFMDDAQRAREVEKTKDFVESECR
jgi:hypothetical protein